jgi:hypothetical protein
MVYSMVVHSSTEPIQHSMVGCAVCYVVVVASTYKIDVHKLSTGFGRVAVISAVLQQKSA